MAAFNGNITLPKATLAGVFNPFAPDIALKLVTAGAIFAAAMVYDGSATIPPATAGGVLSGFTGQASMGLPVAEGTFTSGGSFTGEAATKLVKGRGNFITFDYVTTLPKIIAAGTWAQGWEFAGGAKVFLPDTEGSLFVAPLADSYAAFVCNAKTTGMAEYSNYNFNSLWRGPDGFYYGANGSGIFRLTGKKDNGAAINASIVSGISDLNIREQKYFPDAYLQLRNEGAMELALTVDETRRRSYEIEAREGQQGLHTKRRLLARGIKGRHVQIEIRNVAGSDFDLNGIDLVFEPTRRT